MSDPKSDSLVRLNNPATKDTQTPADVEVSSEPSSYSGNAYASRMGIILAWKAQKYDMWDAGIAKTEIMSSWAETVNDVQIQGYQIMAQGPYAAVAFVTKDRVNGLSFSVDKDYLTADDWKIIRSIRTL